MEYSRTRKISITYIITIIVVIITADDDDNQEQILEQL